MAVIGRFPKQAETVWKRYNIVTTYYWNKYQKYNEYYTYCIEANIEKTHWVNEGYISYSNGYNAFNRNFTLTGDVKSGNYLYLIDDLPRGYKYVLLSSDRLEEVSSATSYATNYAKIVSTIWGRKYTEKEDYIGQVSSTNRSAYPDNSYSGSYWYVYSRSTQSCGSYIGEVSSDNETAYPANGAQSGYWYIKVQQ